jgi:hypothetical protein
MNSSHLQFSTFISILIIIFILIFILIFIFQSQLTFRNVFRLNLREDNLSSNQRRCLDLSRYLVGEGIFEEMEYLICEVMLILSYLDRSLDRSLNRGLDQISGKVFHNKLYHFTRMVSDNDRLIFENQEIQTKSLSLTPCILSD